MQEEDRKNSGQKSVVTPAIDLGSWKVGTRLRSDRVEFNGRAKHSMVQENVRDPDYNFTGIIPMRISGSGELPKELRVRDEVPKWR